MTYAPEHEEESCDRSHRRRMELPRASCPSAQGARTAEDSHDPRDPKRHLLRSKERLSLEATSPRLPALGNRLLVVQKMAHRRNLRATQRRSARGLAGPLGQGPAP